MVRPRTNQGNQPPNENSSDPSSPHEHDSQPANNRKRRTRSSDEASQPTGRRLKTMRLSDHSAERPTRMTLRPRPKMDFGFLNDACTICTENFEDKDEEFAVPNCGVHRFCVKCIQQWANTSTTCPIDRTTFKTVSVIRKIGEKPYCRLHFQHERTLPKDITDPTEFNRCVICRVIEGRRDRIIRCDRCRRAYHIACLKFPSTTSPYYVWDCPPCSIPNYGRKLD